MLLYNANAVDLYNVQAKRCSRAVQCSSVLTRLTGAVPAEGAVGRLGAPEVRRALVAGQIAGDVQRTALPLGLLLDAPVAAAALGDVAQQHLALAPAAHLRAVAVGAAVRRGAAKVSVGAGQLTAQQQCQGEEEKGDGEKGQTVQGGVLHDR